jgi:hypothetical protein
LIAKLILKATIHESDQVQEARFLEPACGDGNFLVPVLQRKLAAVEARFGKSDFDRRHYALLAVKIEYSSLYIRN